MAWVRLANSSFYPFPFLRRYAKVAPKMDLNRAVVVSVFQKLQKHQWIVFQSTDEEAYGGIILKKTILGHGAHKSLHVIFYKISPGPDAVASARNASGLNS